MTLQTGLEIWAALLDNPLPRRLRDDPENARRARLLVGFGVLGSWFGLIYAVFYLLIGHYWGAGIIVCCTLGVAISPWLMWKSGSVQLAGNFFSAILTLGFLGLCFVEGGVHGHAIAWLVSVPLCALLLMGVRPALGWVVIAFLAAALVVGLDLFGVNLPVTYDPKWNSLVSAAGYLGLVIFMFILGFIFENGRASAFQQMQEALTELENKNVQLVSMNKEKNEFLGIAAHDLKNPLAIVLLNSEMIREINDSRQTPKLVEPIIEAVQRMHRLITNLLDVNAIEEGRFTSNIEKCDFGDLVRQCVKQNLPAATHKQIRLQLEVPESIYIRADCIATAQILDNLISNAIKYSPFLTTVKVRLLAESAQARVEVSDQGPGISADDQKRLFQKYTRLSAVPTGGESSTGLGLAIARRLAEAMSGSIRCESTLGGGATFSLSLPLWPTEIFAPVAKPSKSVKTGRVKMSIEATSERIAEL